MSDLRFAFRQLLKAPGFTAVAIVTLALGIGVNTAMFSALHSILLPNLPYPDADRLVRVFQTSVHSQRWPHSPASFLEQRELGRVFETLAATTVRRFNLSEPGQPAEQVRGVLASTELLPMIGIPPQVGRFFLAEEGRVGANNVVVLNHDFWVRRFAADPAVVGRTIRLDGEPVTVIGVMPARFVTRAQWSTVDVLRPLAFSNEERLSRGNHYLDLFGRLKPGVSVAQGNTELKAFVTRLRAERGDAEDQSGLRIESMASASMDARGRLMLWLILGLAGFVLLIACANLANLQFARTALRSRELAIRTALGAPRIRLIRQLLTENVLLAAGGGLLGLLLAHWTSQWLMRELVEDGRPLFTATIDATVLGFAFLVSSGSSLAFGLVPAWIASRCDTNTVLKQGGRGSVSSSPRLRNFLIVAQVGLALVLLTGAGLVVSGLREFGRADVGWRIDGLTAGQLGLPAKNYPDPGRQIQFMRQLQARLLAMPGVEHAAIANALPISGSRSHTDLVVEGIEPAGARRLRTLSFVSPGYFATLGIRLVEGREFTWDDLRDRPGVIIVNREIARTYWPDSPALGRRIGIGEGSQEIVGVVENIRSATDAGEPVSRFQSYLPLGQHPQSGLAIVVRGGAGTDLLRKGVAELDPDLPLSGAGPVRGMVDRFFGQASVAGWLLGSFALLGVLLAALGTYGVISGFVNQRTNEIGVRMALGAQCNDILRLVLAKGVRLTAAGTAIGLIGAAGLARVLALIAPGLQADRLLVFVVVPVLLLAVGFLACWLPARRAARVDPLQALRQD